MEFDLCIQDNKEDVGIMKLATAFRDMAKRWQARALGIS
jgi:hypothetical protein